MNVNLETERVRLFHGDSLSMYADWERPVVIISDGPYGVSGYPGDLHDPSGLAAWYEPHVKAWAKFSSPVTSLWFWNTEIGWANVHPVLVENGWDYVCCCIWDKGFSHIAGNVNTKTIRHFPVVTEVCVLYVRRAEFFVKGQVMGMQDWLRYEWQRTGLPLSDTNKACGVKNAATRKYFTKCHLWYMPPASAFGKLVEYANLNGSPSGKPYFSIDGNSPISPEEWERYRSKFACPFGATNVWSSNQLRGSERLKSGTKAMHLNQKPLDIIRKLITSCSEESDVIWDPFAGLASVGVAALDTNRKCYCAEIRADIYEQASRRLGELEHCLL